MELTLDRGSMQIVWQMSPEAIARLATAFQPSDQEEYDLSDDEFDQVVQRAKREVFEARYGRI